ncbi:glycosyltransferase family 9 protein [Thiorhodovibrio frisius]|uniref:ADP-heptose:LPS heptosyltransferase n=1 Tax=Thiorhodovibrio frisius TaxID=631362 RepID=H8Z4N2_9GAMM|nr:glycosyltransferase family 9 protein [Thiorhodovibrio frisius]EIC20289.1 ADP-heptose:LPS heptosyltransferase [Thiorhodovibrio frisius]WPL21026.1 Lipopolysaccharide heptosyltransferase 1 [Thiorhodovibrio frisius]
MTAEAGPERILLVRLSAIGDIVFASPLIDAFRAAWPQAHLAWLVHPGCASVLVHQPALDAVIEWPQPRLRALLAERRFGVLRRELMRLGQELRAQRFDLAVDLQGLMKSALPTRLTGAPTRIGLDSREGGGLLMTRVIHSPRNDRRIGSEYRVLAEALDLPLGDFAMRLAPGAEARARAEQLIRRAGLSDGFVLFCPFTTRPQKHWFEDRWAELAGRLSRLAADAGIGLPVRLLGAPDDRAAAQRIAQVAGAPLDAWVGETSLPLAAALIERASLLIGVDTGLSHMGIAAQIPTLLLFGATRPYLKTGRAEARVLYHARDCSPCRRRPTCDGRFDCMRAIDVDQVLLAARALLDEHGKSPMCKPEGQSQ